MPIHMDLSTRDTLGAVFSRQVSTRPGPISDLLDMLVAPVDQCAEASYWGLDPLWSADVKILASHLATLADAAPAGDWCFLSNHAIHKVDVMGIVISMDPVRLQANGKERLSFTLDDSTGLIDCVAWGGDAGASSVPLTAPPLGCLLRVLGSLSRFRDARQVRAERWWVEHDPLAECWHWLRAQQCWTQVYSRPFRVPANATPLEPASSEPAFAGCTGNAGTSDATSPATVAAHATDRPGALRELLSAVTSAFESGPERGVDGVGEARIWQVGGATLQRWYPMIADVRRGLDQLVEQSTLYVVDERGGRQRLFRPTEMRAEIAPAPAVSRVEDAVHDGKRSRRGCQ
mgnify:CR=1 FL=1|jgi:hypothetical protein